MAHDLIPSKPATKQEQIASLFQLGITGIDELSHLTQSSSSYVASVLRDKNLMSGYFDLYTSTNRPMNVYSKYFAGRLGFKDEHRAQESVSYIDTLYRQFERIGDYAGMHHSLYMALTMRNRALWSGKQREANVFARWLVSNLANQSSGMIPPVARMEKIIQRQAKAIARKS